MVVVVALLLAVLSAREPLLGSAAALALVVGALVLVRPELLTLLIVGLIYSNAVVIGIRMHGLPVLTAVLVPLALAVPLLHRALTDRDALRLPRVTPLVLLFGAVQAASAVLSADVRAASEDVLAFAVEGAGLFVLLSVVVAGTRLLRSLVWVLVLVGGLLGGLSVLQQATGTFDEDYLGFAQVSLSVVDGTALLTDFTNEAGRSGIPRQSGPIGDQNRYAQVLLVLLPLALALARTARTRWHRILALLAGLAILGGVTLTYSRGAAVALVAVVLLGLVLRLVRLAAVLALAVAGLVVLLAVPAYVDRLTSLDVIAPGRSAPVTDVGARDGAIAGRATENLAALLAMRENPAFGVGPGAFPTTYRSYAERIGGRPRLEAREAHNLYLGVGAELGVVGLVVFLTIVGVVLRDLWRSRRDSTDVESAEFATAFILALLLYLASGVFLHLSYQRYFWVLLALAAAATAADTPRRGALPA